MCTYYYFYYKILKGPYLANTHVMHVDIVPSHKEQTPCQPCTNGV